MVKYQTYIKQKDVPGLTVPLVSSFILLLLLAHAQSHHAPGKILESLLVWQLLLGFCEEFPDLSGERVILLKLVNGQRRIGCGIIERREQSATKQVVVSDGIGPVGGRARSGRGIDGLLLMLVVVLVVVLVALTVAMTVAMAASIIVIITGGMLGPSRKSKIVFCHGRIHRGDRPRSSQRRREANGHYRIDGREGWMKRETKKKKVRERERAGGEGDQTWMG